MPTKYFAGNSLAAFVRNTPAVVEDTTAGRFDSAFVASSIKIPSSGSAFLQSSSFSATGTIWARCEMYAQTPTGGYSPDNPDVGITFLNGTNKGYRLKIDGPYSGYTYQMQYWSGAAWVNWGSSFVLGMDAKHVFAIKIVLGTSFEVYAAGAMVASSSSTPTGAPTTITSLRINSTHLSNVNGNLFVSQVMVGDYDIRDCRFLAATLNGNSASNTGAASGAYGDINETVLDDSTTLTITAAGNKAGQTHAAVTVPAGYIIGGMVINGRGRVNGTITDGKLGVRGSGGTNSSGSGLGYNGGYEPRCRIVTADPDTGTNFTQSGFNASEIYEEAV